MANLHKYTVQEALNASQGNSGGWTVNDVLTVNATGGATVSHTLGASTTILLLQPTAITQISFTTSDTNIDTTDDVAVPADTLTSIAVPRGLGSTIVLNVCGDTATSGTIRVVEV